MIGHSQSYVLSGRPGELVDHKENSRIVGYVQTVLTDRPAVAGAWIAEEALRAWRHSGTPLLPTPDLVAAGGDLDLLRQVARVVGEMLSVRGFAGVWGSPRGFLSNDALPWMGDALIAPFADGLSTCGIETAWYDDTISAWRAERWGLVARGGGDGNAGILHVTASELAAAIAAGDRLAQGQAQYGREPAPSLASLVDRLADRGITLIDDPGILPLDPACTMTVEDPAGTGASAVLGVVRPDNSTGEPLAGKKTHALVWVDELGRAPRDDEVLIAVSCRRPEFIAEMPKEAVKIAVYDDVPEVWRRLLMKLCGDSPWTGRLPREIPASAPACHQSHYTTEQPHVHPSLRFLEEQPTVQLVHAMILEEARALRRMADLAPTIAQAVEIVRKAWREGYRLFYIGAGSAGRLGMLDAAEIPPTFGVANTWAKAIMAGGPEAFQKAREGVEDDATQGRLDTESHGIGKGDVLVAVTAHGNTPYVLGAAKEARRVGAAVIGLVNNPGTALAAVCDIVVEVASGPEALVGSTRLKAGTAEKLVLNTISTLGMVGLGRTYDNLMVDFMLTNNKLKERAIRVCMMATGFPRTSATRLVDLAHGNLKVAIVAGKLSVTVEEAEELLKLYGSAAAAIRNGAKEPS